ncbi:TPA: hypothetical protein ACYURS_001197 [Legionella pneumophila]
MYNPHRKQIGIARNKLSPASGNNTLFVGLALNHEVEATITNNNIIKFHVMNP